MKLSVKDLCQAWPTAVFHGFNDASVLFDLFNIAHLAQFEAMSPEIVLYFVVYEDAPEVLGWYNQAFDRTANIDRLRGKSNIFFVVDGRISDSQMQGLNYCRVNNIFEAIDQLRLYIMSKMLPDLKVVGITGSVGKTTGAALLQAVFSTRYKCGRIYSKRLTPLSLSSWLVNFLSPSDEIVALEYSMYEKHHIDMLSDILRPDLAVLLNIWPVHLGVRGVNTVYDIQEGKAPLIHKAHTSFLNHDDALVMELCRPTDVTFSVNNSKADAYIRLHGELIELVLNFADQRIWVNPYLRTTLFYYQALVAATVGAYLGVPSPEIEGAINSFMPQENRINWIDIHGYQVLFDGNVFGGGRLRATAGHHYQTSVFMIHSFDFGEENIELQIQEFRDGFAKFTEVRVLDTPENQEVLAKYGLNLNLVSKKDLTANLHLFDYRVFVFGTYFRRYPDMQYLYEFLGS